MSRPTVPRRPSEPSRALPVLFGGFFLTGIASVLLGPLIPELLERWDVTPKTAASLFVAQFAMSSASATVSSFNIKRSLILGYSLMAVGLAGLAAGSWVLARIAMALVGLGLGFTIPATNLQVALLNPQHRASSLATLNLIWGAGATACPLFFAALLGRFPASLILVLLAGAAVSVTVAVLVYSPPPARADEGETAAELETAAKLDGGFELRLLLMLAAMLFLYIGSESAIGGWLVTLSDQLSEKRSVLSMLIGSGFWGALLVGRAATSVLVRHVRESLFFAVSLTIALLGAATLLTASSHPSIAVGAVLAGLGLAPLFPLTVALLTAEARRARSRATGWVFAIGGAGGAVLPWLAARLADDPQALRQGFIVPLLGLLLLGAFSVAYRRVAVRGPARKT